jgi:ComF family protein
VGFLDFFFPRRCLGCGREGAYFCSNCLNYLSLSSCPCRPDPSFVGLTSVFAYRGLIKKAVKKLKYHFVSDLAGDLVELFLTFVGEDQAFTRYCQNKPIFIPIPLHPRRLNWRGFNQSELLGKLIAANLDLPFAPDILIRVKETLPQADLDKKSRRENVKNAFILNPHLKLKIKNLKFIVFDDVWTSGATISEAAKILKKAGARSVWALTLAR